MKLLQFSFGQLKTYNIEILKNFLGITFGFPPILHLITIILQSACFVLLLRKAQGWLSNLRLFKNPMIRKPVCGSLD